MTQARTVTATFVLTNYTLTVSVGGSSGGKVTSSPPGISGCTGVAASFPSGTPVQLTATATAGYASSGWSGDCAGEGNPCSLIMTGPRSVTAAFSAIPTVTVAATVPTAKEAGLVRGLFTFTRTGSTTAALTVSYTVSGTATPGSDYLALGPSVTFPIGAATITDNARLQAATLFYRSTGVASYWAVAMAGAGSTFSATILRSAVTCPGVRYYLAACDAAGNVRRAPGTAPGTPYNVAVGFTDDPLLARIPIKAAHITELRSCINGLRAYYHRAFPRTWATDPTLYKGSTTVKGAHLTELRAALDDAYTAAGKTPMSYAEPISVMQTIIKAGHLMELRKYVRGLE